MGNMPYEKGKDGETNLIISAAEKHQFCDKMDINHHRIGSENP